MYFQFVHTSEYSKHYTPHSSKHCASNLRHGEIGLNDIQLKARTKWKLDK